jgi:hypothetical protein
VDVVALEGLIVEGPSDLFPAVAQVDHQGAAARIQILLTVAVRDPYPAGLDRPGEGAIQATGKDIAG